MSRRILSPDAAWYQRLIDWLAHTTHGLVAANGVLLLCIIALPGDIWMPYFTLEAWHLFIVAIFLLLATGIIIGFGYLTHHYGIMTKRDGTPFSRPEFSKNRLTVMGRWIPTPIRITYPSNAFMLVFGYYMAGAAMEEFLFRGFLFAFPSEVWPSLMPVFAIGSVAIFTALHRQYTRVGLIPIAILGLLLTGVVIVTHNLLVAAIAHWTINSFQLLRDVHIDFGHDADPEGV